MQLIGTTLGQYRITEQIGEGGMATVYKAYQPSLDRFVAVKVLAPLHARTPGFKERFFREAKAVAQLSHPNILPVYDVGMENDICYLVMKCIIGGSMRDLMGDKMALPRVCRYIDQVSGALDHAHERGIIHRDIKSHNLLLEGEWLFLMDFGIAKIMEASTVLTSAGELMGTPCYMSPEQASGKPVDHRTDIYSLGIVLYEMITGTVPFKGETPYGVIYKHIHEALPLPRNFRPDLPEIVERVVLKALAKSPDQRYDSAGRLAEALREAVASTTPTVAQEFPHDLSSPQDNGSTHPLRKGTSSQETERLSPPSRPIVAGESVTPPRRNRVLLLLAAGVLLILAGVLAAVLYYEGQGRIQRPPSDKRQRETAIPLQSASLQLDSTPQGAAITVDGAHQGATPAVLNLPPGEHRVRLELAGYEAWEDRVQLVEAGKHPIRVELKPIPRAASLAIDSTPRGAEIFVNDAPKGTTPMVLDLPLGSYSIRFGLSGYRELERSLKLGEAKQYQLNAELLKSDAPAPSPSPDQGPPTEGPQAHFEKGKQFLEAKDTDAALDSFMKAASLGHAESQNEVGYMIMHGLGVKKNLKEAAAWYRKAAAQGYAASQNNLGILYLKGGPGILQDDREAFAWFRMAAEQGDRDGQFYLANMLRYGRGQRVDMEKAAQWYRKAADQGHDGAAKALKALGK
jgi:serine/threonine protein kinase